MRIFRKRKIIKMLEEYSNSVSSILARGIFSEKIFISIDFKKAKEEREKKAFKFMRDLKLNNGTPYPFDNNFLTYHSVFDSFTSKVFEKTDYVAEFISVISEEYYNLDNEIFQTCKIQFHFEFETKQVMAIVFKKDLHDIIEGDQILVGISRAYLTPYFQIQKGNFKKNFKKVNIMSNDDTTEILRYGDGSPGSNARFITKRYFANFYIGKDRVEDLAKLLDERIVVYSKLGLLLNDELYAEALFFYNKLPNLIFLLTLFEALQNDELYRAYLVSKNGIYKIILEEYNKYAPEENQINMNLDDIANETNYIMLILETYK